MRSSTMRRNQNTPFKYQNSPNFLGEELEDHLNISSESVTRVGKLLDLEHNQTFRYPHLGTFRSVFALWQWLQNDTNNDNFRFMTTTDIKKHLHENRNVKTNFVKNFKVIIANALWLKIKYDKEALAELKNIPIGVSYVFYKTVTTYPVRQRLASKYPSWLSDIVEEIHKAVIANNVPDFSKLITDPIEIRFAYLEGFLRDYLPVVYEKLTDDKCNNAS